MLCRTHAATLHGLDGRLVSVEVEAGRGLPMFQIVGHADPVVRESRDRIRAAFRHCGLEFPAGRVTVSLAPSDLPKAGPGLDLPIAIAVAATCTPLAAARLARTLLVGELGLDGRLRPVRGVLALTLAARSQGLEDVITPLENREEAALCPDLRAWGAPSLSAVLRSLADDAGPGGDDVLIGGPPTPGATPSAPDADLADVRGQETARRALEVAAGGAHNLRLIGPPGAGKKLLSRRLPGLLPDLPVEEALEATRIHSVAGLLQDGALIVRPPFRAPHHTSSEAGMLGGGRPLRPGEISLAHRGVLFLDELPEFRRGVLEALRQPLEEGCIPLVRAHDRTVLPARFQLVAAMNPCPCGHRGDSERECRCDDGQLRRYRMKLSGPLLDRIDLHVSVPPLRWRDLSGAAATATESSVTVRARVLRARARQRLRYRGCGYLTNAELPVGALRSHCPTAPKADQLLERAVRGLGLSMRAYVRVLRVARTIADLEGVDRLSATHVAEAVGYRALDPVDGGSR